MGPIGQCEQTTAHGMHSWGKGLCPGIESVNPLDHLPTMLEDSATEVEEEWETGQPNGIGETEPSWYREWFSDERVTHRRRVIMITGPWEEIEK